MTERMKMVLERTEKTICRHLEVLNEDADNGGGIESPQMLDDFKDCLKCLKMKCEIMHIDGNGEVSKTKAVPSMI